MTIHRTILLALLIAVSFVDRAPAGLWSWLHHRDECAGSEEGDDDDQEERRPCCLCPPVPPRGKVVSSLPVEWDAGDPFAESAERGARSAELKPGEKKQPREVEPAPPAESADDEKPDEKKPRGTQPPCTLDDVCRRQAALEKRLEQIDATLKKLSGEKIKAAPTKPKEPSKVKAANAGTGWETE